MMKRKYRVTFFKSARDPDCVKEQQGASSTICCYVVISEVGINNTCVRHW